MKKYLYIFIFFVMFSMTALTTEAQNTENQEEKSEYVITVKTEDLDKTWVFLSARRSGGWKNLDSALYSKSRDIVFRGSLRSPEVLYIRAENTGKPASLYAENSEILVLPDFQSPNNTIVEGSSIHDELKLYESVFTELNELKEKAYDEYMRARNSGNKKKMDEITDLFDEYSSSEMEMNRKYVTSHSDSYLSPYIIRSKMYYSLNVIELKKLVNNLDPSIANSVYVEELIDYISVLEKVAIGEKFTDFELPASNGEMFKLSSLTGKNYLLIDFWASWCQPCRIENPNVVKIYNKFHEKGFDILGVSFDTKKENWLKAIEDDKLSWNHVSDLKAWGNAAGKLYGVNSIPHTVLLDPEGIIIAKNLNSEELEEKLSQLLE